MADLPNTIRRESGSSRDCPFFPWSVGSSEIAAVPGSVWAGLRCGRRGLHQTIVTSLDLLRNSALLPVMGGGLAFYWCLLSLDCEPTGHALSGVSIGVK